MKKTVFTILISIVICFTSTVFYGCANKTFTVTFMPNAQDAYLYSGEAVQTVEDAKKLQPPVFVREGYNFIGWSRSLTDIKSDQKVYANWAKYNFTVTFNLNGGELKEGDLVQQVDSGISIKPPLAKRVGYTLFWDKDIASITENCQINAMWVANEYKIHLLDDDLVTPLFSPVNVTFNSVIEELPSVEQIKNIDGKEYRFSGWVDKEGQGVPNSFTYKFEGDYTLYASWVEKDYYLLSFDLDGGIVSSYPTYYDSSVGLTITNTPKKEGYNFIGWSVDGSSGLVSEVDIPAGSNKDFTFKANWVAKEFTINYLFDGLADKKITFNQCVGQLAQPQRQGYVFDGWYYGDLLISEDYVWKEDTSSDTVTLVPQFKRVYTITFTTTAIVNDKAVETAIITGDDVTKINLTVIEGQRLNELVEWLTFPVVQPIMAGEYYYSLEWVYLDSTGKYYKINLDTPINEKNFPHSIESGAILLRPRCYSKWSGYL